MTVVYAVSTILLGDHGEIHPGEEVPPSYKSTRIAENGKPEVIECETDVGRLLELGVAVRAPRSSKKAAALSRAAANAAEEAKARRRAEADQAVLEELRGERVGASPLPLG